MASPSGLDRLINLSDAVVAIAITLLVLPLVDTVTSSTTNMGDLLSDSGYKIFSFALSFIVISRFWLVHHAMYLNVIGYNAALIWVNFLWLFTIVFLPFPTELVSSGGVRDATTSGVYVGTLLVTSVASELALWILIRSPELLAEPVRGTLSLTSSTLSTGAMALALIVSVTIPSIGLWALLVLLAVEPARHLIGRKRR